ncbi:MAG: 5'-methylthioadenosine/adenosylhomocysteine nucleosidase [Clostridiales bacterium]|nr:5'-methylthioadenosine/adenosylhomocysteine nucleosidase [Clostridiales bacterium]
MLCILAAMREEVELLLERVTVTGTEELGCGRQIYFAEYAGTVFLIAVSMIGKVNSAVTMQYVLDRYEVDRIINIGTAGGIASVFKKNDIMLATAAYQHDYDLGPVGGDGYKAGTISNIPKASFSFDREMNGELSAICKGLGYTLTEGILVSGDQFISDGKKVKKLKKDFSAIACEMEGGALIQTAALNGFKKIASIKAISDNADENAAEDFSDMTGAKEKIRDIVCRYIYKLKVES